VTRVVAVVVVVEGVMGVAAVAGVVEEGVAVVEGVVAVVMVVMVVVMVVAAVVGVMEEGVVVVEGVLGVVVVGMVVAAVVAVVEEGVVWAFAAAFAAIASMWALISLVWQFLQPCPRPVRAGSLYEMHLGHKYTAHNLHDCMYLLPGQSAHLDVLPGPQTAFMSVCEVS
jgi:hypothetical protein